LDPLGRVLLIRRGHEPGAGKHALPGGFVKIGETVMSACRREVSEETGIDVAEIVRFGSEADIMTRSRHVRFTPQSGHSSVRWDVQKAPQAN
jgi:ADP-ribose pyrophosphatase YjhB (NUDIX family)